MIAARMLLLGLAVLSLAPLPTWAVTPAPATGTGLYGDYYATKDFTGTVKLRRTDRAIQFDWGMRSPFTEVPADGFSVRWTGEVEAPVTGDYTFATNADDGVRLWVNGRLLVDDWQTHPATLRRATPIRLTAGVRYSIKLEYFENGGSSSVRLLWAYPGQPEQTIPQARLYVPDRVDYLSDMTIARKTTAVELDKRSGQTLSVAGVSFAKGLAVTGDNEVVYKLNRLYDDFRATVGIDDSAGAQGSVVYEVWVDGTLMWDSTLQRGSTAGQYVHVDVTGRDELRLVVRNGGDGATMDRANWADAHVILQSGGAKPAPAPDPDLYLSELAWQSARSDWGPVERDMSNGEQMAADGKQISINGRKFTYGLGVHSLSEIVFKVDKAFQRFVADVGVDDEVGGGRGSVVFQVLGDGTKLFETVRMTQGMSARRVDLNITGVTMLKLVVGDAGDGGGYDHADWGGARLYRLLDGTPPPVVTVPGAPGTLTAAAGNAKVTLTWGAATGATSYNVYRGTAAGAEAATPVAMGIGGTSYTDTGVVNGTTYFYKVSGVNTGGIGARSNEASAKPAAVQPPGVPGNLTATGAVGKITLQWSSGSGAASYSVYRGTASGAQATAPLATGVTATNYADLTGLNGVTYFYKVVAVNLGGTSGASNEASAAPLPVVAPANLTAAPGDAKVTLNWGGVTGAASYNVYRGTATGAQAATPVATGVTGTSYLDATVVNGTAYFYKVAGVNAGGVGTRSNEATATPKAPVTPPPAPANVSAVPGNLQVTLSWTAVSGAVTYNVYRGTTAGGQSGTPVATGLTAPTFVNTGLVNGTTYYYKVSGVNTGGIGTRSAEVSATPQAPVTPPVVTPLSDQALWRLLRQATWGPTQADFDRLKAIGVDAWIDEQFAATPSVYPDTLLTQNMEWTEEHFFQLALTGNDQLRQRVAWALSQIWVVSGVELVRADAMVPWMRLLQSHAFGSFYDLMRDGTMHPAMGEYLDMVNNKKSNGTILPNENFAREILQLFTIGLAELNPDGSAKVPAVATYGQDDVLELARVFTGWTYPDAVAGQPTKLNPARYDGPMEAVEAFHDTGAKRFLGTDVPPGMTTQQDLDNALAIIFRHANVGPFISRQLIQRLVTSNPSPAYIAAIAAVFADNGSGVRGDLKAVVKAILKHPEAQLTAPTAGKLAEPALFITRQLRAIGGNVANYPFMSDLSTDMGQRIFHSPSVFNYYSPNFRIAGTTLTGPEFQLYTTATGMTRANFVASLISGGFGSEVTLNFAPWEALAADAGALVYRIDLLAFGGTLSAEARGVMITAIQASPTAREKVMTAFYLAFTSSQFQVEH